jgi:hypothetical protein
MIAGRVEAVNQNPSVRKVTNASMAAKSGVFSARLRGRARATAKTCDGNARYCRDPGQISDSILAAVGVCAWPIPCAREEGLAIEKRDEW